MSERFEKAIALFDAINAQDPREVEVDGQIQAKALAHGRWMSQAVLRLDPDADEALLLAARCQHLERWVLKRDSFPQGRVGYLKWRTAVGRRTAERGAQLLAKLGYDAEICRRVERMNRKKDLRVDAAAQCIEDALCLVFLQYEFDAFADKHDQAKLIDILQKTWRKMSPNGQQEALALQLSKGSARLVALALE